MVDGIYWAGGEYEYSGIMLAVASKNDIYVDEVL
jgi:hypothetical protein